MTFLTGTDEIRKMARWIFEPSLSFESPVNFKCNNMSFLKICSLATLVAIFSFLAYNRPPQYGTTFEVEDLRG